ncbi:hypothetical protein MAR_016704 [Mya arenaria]
MIERS